MTHRRVVIGRADEFRQHIGDTGFRIQTALVGQNTGQRTGKRLGRRHQDVGVLGPHTVAIDLSDDGAAMQHDEAVEMTVIQHVGNRSLFRRPPVW